jgi:branched-chain amino acid transport system permease protein
LKRLNSKQLEIIIAIFVLLIPALAFRLIGLNYAVYLLVLVALWAFLGQAWNICYGYAGVLSFGHAAFFGLGAYVSTILFLNYGLTPWIGMLIGGGFAALLGLFVGIPTIRLRGAYFALSTIAMAEIVRLLVLKLDFITAGASGLLLPANLSPLQLYFKDTFYWFLATLAILVALLIFSYKLEKSKLGKALRAMKENETAAASLGIYPLKYKIIALMISAFFTGIGGVFYAQYLGYIRPDFMLIPTLSDEILIVAILGGVGTLLGAVVGSLIFIVLRSVFLGLFGGGMMGSYLILYGALTIVVVMFLPEGIYPRLRKVVARIRSKT